MDSIAERYVKLVLGIGRHDPDMVDAYHGPPAWVRSVEEEARGLPALQAEAEELGAALAALPVPADELQRLRREYLRKQVSAMAARCRMLRGERFGFDEESAALYDAVAPAFPEPHYRALVDALEPLLPGTGPVPARYEEYRKRFVIPPDRLDRVFTTAVEESRRRTLAHIPLPEGERFRVEYVTGKPWSGYNWFKGNAFSLIQVNTELPIFIDRAVDLAAHEGYPGHHVYNALLESNLLRNRSWMEFSVYALFSPQSLVAEGTANYGIEMAFPAEERVAFEEEVLFPCAGLDPASAAGYYRVQDLAAQLAYAGNEAARGYIDGAVTKEEAVQWLVDYALMGRDRAEQRIRFFDTYRSYVINYNLGKDLVRAYVEGKGGLPTAPARRWEVFRELLSSPRLPSGLR